MFNTTNEGAYESYLLGGRTFSCGVKATYLQARTHFEEAVSADPNFARAKGWLAYTIAEGWSYGWFTDDDLENALTLAQEAVTLDQNDYQNHWSLATVLKHRGDLDGARESLEQACLLRNDDPDLLVESSELMVYQGRHAKALERIEHAMALKSQVRAGDQTVRVPHPDWYYWDFAWASYFNGRVELDTEQSHQRSLESLQMMSDPPNNANLLRAANYVRLSNSGRAADFMKVHQENEPEWDVEKEKNSKHFKIEEDQNYWIEALIDAGLPE